MTENVWSGPAVLVVDDDPQVISMFRRLARGVGVAIRCAESAEAAQALLEEGVPQLIVCDYRLPGLDGMTFLEKVHARYPQVRRVLHTGEAVFRVNLALDIPLLAKPCPSEELEALLMSTLPSVTTKS
ncbi:MAG: response regulator [Myxococcaceae bacterium]